MSRPSRTAAIKTPVDGTWISLNGATRLDLRAGRFVESHWHAACRYVGRFEFSGNQLLLVDSDTGMRTVAHVDGHMLLLRDDTLVRAH